MRSLSEEQCGEREKKEMWIKMKSILWRFFPSSVQIRNLILPRRSAFCGSSFFHGMRDFSCFLVRAIGFRGYNLPDSLIFLCVRDNLGRASQHFPWFVCCYASFFARFNSCRLDFIFHIDTEPSRKTDINQITRRHTHIAHKMHNNSGNEEKISYEMKRNTIRTDMLIRFN